MTAPTEKNMLAKLHVKFTAIICGVSALILIVSFGYIAWSNHTQKVNAVYSELNVALESVVTKGPRDLALLTNTAAEGQEENSEAGASSSPADEPAGSPTGEPTDEPTGEPADEPSGANPAANNDSSNTSSNNAPNNEDEQLFSFNFGYSTTTPPRIGENRQNSWAFPVALYAIAQNNTATSVDLISGYSTATVDEETLETALNEALSAETDQGFLQSSGLYYKKITLKDDSVYFAFADQGVVDNGTYLSRSLIVVGIVIELLVLALAWAFSRWALRPIQRAWDSQQQFIADASHEMKTPLTVIMANASIALKKPQATIAEQSQWIEGIQDEAQNMEHLVLDMLALAQPENAPTQKDAQENVNLSEMTERASLQFEALAFERGVILDQSIEPNITVAGDPAKLQRLIGTLIDNACKYADKETTIDVSLKAAGAHCILSVHNWGTPIDPKDIPHVFDRFYRSDKSRDRSSADGEHSFGLGLAIAQKIVQIHHGTLGVTSTAEEGTTFSARLPRM